MTRPQEDAAGYALAILIGLGLAASLAQWWLT